MAVVEQPIEDGRQVDPVVSAGGRGATLPAGAALLAVT